MPQNADEEDLLKSSEELEVTKKAVEAYREKAKKIADIRLKVAEWSQEGAVVELLDRAGERKFLNTKRDSKALDFLGDKNVYHLARVKLAQTPDGSPSSPSRRRGRAAAHRRLSRALLRRRRHRLQRA